MGIPYPGVKNAVWRRVSVQFEADFGEIYTHEFDVLYRKLNRKDQAEYMKPLIDLRKRMQAGEDDEFALFSKLEDLKERVLLDSVLNWRFTGIDGNDIPYSDTTLQDLIQYPDYRDALWDGFERGRNYKQDRKKNS